MNNSTLKQAAKANLLFSLLIIASYLSTIAQTDLWVQKNDLCYNAANVPELTPREGAVSFSIGNKGYLGTGIDDISPYYKKDFREYDPNGNTWTQKADFEGTARSSAVGLSIGNKGYIGTGLSGNYPDYIYYKDFWEYHPDANSWTKKADFGGTACSGAVGFSIGNKGYLGTGFNNGAFYKDFWEYDPDDE